MNKLIKFINNKKNKRNIIIGVITLLVIIGIIIVFISNNVGSKIKIGKYPQKEISVNLDNTKCSASKRKKILSDAKKISLEYDKEKIKVGYDETTGEEILRNVFNVTITNVTKDFYVIVKNDYTDEEKKLTNKDAKDNNVVFQTMYANDIIVYTVEIYTTSSNCEDELYRKFTFTTPVFNIYSGTSYCVDNEEFEYCKEEIYTSQISFEQFKKKLEEYKKSK